jgi:hypothetical protein
VPAASGAGSQERPAWLAGWKRLGLAHDLIDEASSYPSAGAFWAATGDARALAWLATSAAGSLDARRAVVKLVHQALQEAFSGVLGVPGERPGLEAALDALGAWTGGSGPGEALAHVADRAEAEVNAFLTGNRTALAITWLTRAGGFGAPHVAAAFVAGAVACVLEEHPGRTAEITRALRSGLACPPCEAKADDGVPDKARGKARGKAAVPVPAIPEPQDKVPF